ncbi:MAG: alcohol dehydrogenase catalytic domain-containing protein [Firmicutes bacterium]|nr:alcohol dehydrogenase catalytic domain-containing protein [Bacillota bacterium]
MLPKQMRAVRFYGPGDLRVEDVPLPSLKPGDLLVRVEAVGICATDRKILARGHFKIGPESRPRILGHEIVGKVVVTGEQTRGFSEGQRVAIAPNVGCGTCSECLVGDVHLCRDYQAFGISMDGGMAEFIRIPEKAVRAGNVIPLPNDVSDAEAALSEPLACCYNSLIVCRLQPGENLLVVGAGAMGLMHVALGRCMGANRVLLVGRTPERLQRGKALGADVVLEEDVPDLDRHLMDWTDGRGADVVVVTVPSAELAARAIGWAARKGRVNLFAGMPSGHDVVCFRANPIHYGQVTITGTTGANAVHLRRVIGLLAARLLPTQQLITARLPLARAHDAFAWANSPEHVRVQLVPHDSAE